MRASVGLIIALCFWSSFQGFAQQSAPPAQAPPLEPRPSAAPTTPQRPIVLDVVVTDKSGNPVSGLQQQDFTLLDDKQPQPIVSFHATEGAGDLPLQAIVVVDAVNTPFQAVALERSGLDKFLHAGGGELPLPMSLIVLTDKSAGQSPTSQNGNDLAISLAAQEGTLRTINRSQGYYGGIERAQISVSALEQIIGNLQSQAGRKLLIWLGPGWPILSGPQVQLTSKTRMQLFRTAVDLSAGLREARITLYCINPNGPSGSMQSDFYYEDFVKGVTTANHMQNGNLAAQVLGVQTGGTVINMSNDLPDSLNRCLADRKAFYTITFNAPAADHPDEYHTLQVKINKPHLTARTRTGYYAQP